MLTFLSAVLAGGTLPGPVITGQKVCQSAALARAQRLNVNHCAG
jgi:hypothetical protein